ncbi:MAG TPA: LLM class F420-dependent oxidoreductase [Candidatus Limnocylindrales bacterium]
MRVGLQLPSFSFPGGASAIRPTLIAIAQCAEANGFASLWVMDHLFQLPEDTGLGGPEEPMLEAYTTLGFLAAATDRIPLGPMVASAVYREPGLLVKAATTLDVLAGGRTYLGLGAAWYEREARGLGLPFPPRRERFEHLEDTLRVATAMWSGDRSPVHGTHHTLGEPISVPAPVSSPRPRILIGGGGERRTLRLVARYADACNILVPDPGESRHKLEVLRRHCEELGRDFGEIETTSLVETDLRPGRGSADTVIAALRAQADEGIEHVIVNLPDAYVLERLETYGREIIPAVA